jgi:hypothetical protein
MRLDEVAADLFERPLGGDMALEHLSGAFGHGRARQHRVHRRDRAQPPRRRSC